MRILLPQIHVYPAHVVPIHNVAWSMKRLSALVFLTLWVEHQIVDLNVQLIRNVPLTWLVSMRNVKILVQDRAVSMPSAMLSIILPFVLVSPAILEIPSLVVILHVRFLLRCRIVLNGIS